LKRNTLVLQVEFLQPYQISPLMQQDKLVFAVLDEGMPFFRSQWSRQYLSEINRVMEAKVRK
jgi:hypothetical protein